MNQMIQFYVRIERYEPPVNSILFRPHYEVMAVDSDKAEERFGKHLHHLLESYGKTLVIRRDNYIVPNTNYYLKSYTLVSGNKDLASVILMPVLSFVGAEIQELEQGDL